MDENKINTLVNQYYSNLIFLVNQAYENKQKVSSKNKELKELYKTLIFNIENLLEFIETRFSNYLSLNKPVPFTYLTIIKKQLFEKIDRLKKSLVPKVDNKDLSDLLLEQFYSFAIGTKSNPKITFREVVYHKELVQELENLVNLGEEQNIYIPLNQLLISLNFNSTRYLNFLTKRIAGKINELQNISEKLEKLLWYFKNLNQVHSKPNVILNPGYGDLKTELSNWFSQEIYYLEKKLHLSIIPLQNETADLKSSVSAQKEKTKVLCILSSDQMALILRAADELKILMARSMSDVFKTIVPHLSTPYKENLSVDSMRSKSYSAEERDKEIAIQTLEHIIKKISEY
ncbi:hypothetical protein [Rubrolithibacter danxiaensis]|uniref:hypothetical protein n=1 Tax=Rubrolithibacter danxiaensis TaxID=3390805 RepID=UPI003BF7F72C